MPRQEETEAALGEAQEVKGELSAGEGKCRLPGEHTQDSPSLLSISNSALKQGDLPGERTERDEGG